MKVPGVDHDSARARVRDQNSDLLVIGFRLGERVVQHDVDGVLDWLVRVEFGDDDAVAVLVEHVGHAHQHHVVVVDERHGDRRCSGAGPCAEDYLPRGVVEPPLGVLN